MVLSICIPSYNRLDELKKLLCSISKAKSDEFEVVVVDNGSSDDIDFIKINDDRIRVIKRDLVSRCQNEKYLLKKFCHECCRMS